MKLGIFGGGQLGRMLAQAALPLDVECQVLDPTEAPCAAAAARHIHGDYADQPALDALTDGVDAVTYEFENVPVDAVKYVAARLPASPGAALGAHGARLAELRREGGRTPPPTSAAGLPVRAPVWPPTCGGVWLPHSSTRARAD